MKGVYGRILRIDLTAQQFQIQVPDEHILLSCLGGKGLASYLLYENNPARVDPFSPDNTLIFSTGPITRSSIWGSSRYGVYTKSPQTGIYSESYAGGKVPEAVDASGFDAIMISGKSRTPVILLIHPEGAEFHDAVHIWGMDTYETEDAVNALFSRQLLKGE
ncbi:MAG: aldehyde ferredoxin oxidoreductase N-terminal domain-containing protein, partial [Thermodesulfobacteriota bacterium]